MNTSKAIITIMYQPFVMQQKVVVQDANKNVISTYNLEMDQIPELVETLSKNNVGTINFAGSKDYIAKYKDEISEKISSDIEINIL